MTFPGLVVEFAPDCGPFDTPVWVDITDRVLSAEWVDGKQADLGEFPPGEATIVLKNDDRLFDPEHAAGTYYGSLLPRVPFRITASETLLLLWGVEPLEWDGESLVWSGDRVDLFYGFVQDGWEQDYMPPEGSTCTVKLVDLLAVLQGYTLNTALFHEVMADAPVAYWTLDESDGTVMGDRSGNALHGHYDNALQGQDPLIVDSKGKSMFCEHVGDNRGEYKGTLPPTAAPITREAWVKFERELAERHTIVTVQRDNAYGSSVDLCVETSAEGSPNGELVVDFRGLGGFYKARGHTRIDDDEIHHVAMTMASTAAADIKLYVDGVLQTKTLISGTTGGSWAGHHIWVVGNVAAATLFDYGLGGFIDEVAVYDTALSAARILAHYEAGADGLAGQRSDEQIAWVLDTIGVPAAMYDLDEGRSIMGPLQCAGRDALEVLREITRTEQGAFFVAHHDGGKLKFRQRYASFQDTRSTIVQAEFTDDPSASGTYARVEAGTLQVDPNGIQTIINQAQVTWRGGEEIVDDSVGSPYGPRGVSIDTQAATSSLARGLGQWLVALNSTPAARIRSLGINPGAAPTEFPIALETRIGDRVSFRSQPQSVGSATTKALEVQGRHHQVTDVQWTTLYYLTNAVAADVDLFTLGTSELDDTHVLAY